MSPKRGYRYETTIPPGTFAPGAIECFFTAKTEAGDVRFAAENPKAITAQLVPPSAPLPLFDAAQDLDRLVFTRIGDGVRHGIFQRRKATDTEPAALRLFFPLSYDRTLDDYTASLAVKDRIADRRKNVSTANTLRVNARGESNGQQIHLTLVEADGTSWSKRLTVSTNWQEHVVPVSDLKIARGVKLPLGYPERWNYWLAPAKGRGGPEDHPRLEAVERVQISFRPGSRAAKSDADAWADVSSVMLTFE
jgi:hypothetical protein